MAQGGNDFNAIKISLASPEQIKLWSYGEVMKPETINYRTLRPEKDGLFCEKIFGPTKDWECYCGKYKKIRHRGITCDRCGVEVARAKVRRERMGHIQLAAPVAHIWFSKGTPSRLGLMLNLSPKNLDRVLYFAQYIITRLDENARADAVNMRHSHLDRLVDRIDLPVVVKMTAERLAERLKAFADDIDPKLAQLSDNLTEFANDTTSLIIDVAQRDFEDALRELTADMERRAADLDNLAADIYASDALTEEQADALQPILDGLSGFVGTQRHSAAELLDSGLTAEYRKAAGGLPKIEALKSDFQKVRALLSGLKRRQDAARKLQDGVKALRESTKALNDLANKALGIKENLHNAAQTLSGDDGVDAPCRSLVNALRDISELEWNYKSIADGLQKSAKSLPAKYAKSKDFGVALTLYKDANSDALKAINGADLEPIYRGMLRELPDFQRLIPRYYEEILSLREALYDNPGGARPLALDEGIPDGFKDWKEVGRRYDRIESGFADGLKEMVAVLDELGEDDAAKEHFGDEDFEAKREALAEQVQDFGNTSEEIESIEALNLGELLTENQHRTLNGFAGGVFDAGMGAEAILELLEQGDMDAVHNADGYDNGSDEIDEIHPGAGRLSIRHSRHRRDVSIKMCHERGDFCNSVSCLHAEIRATSGQRQKKAFKRLRLIESFRKSGNKPEWMILVAQPVLPPELRPMVQLDGGRFATSDLNDLYRRVINRNNRLKRLTDLQAPEIIVRNEKRMLQESVDALVDNGRRGRAVAGSHNHKLKSLSDLLRGKQGRFRQNLLGKRVDYSGRSVIIVGPELKLHQCGLPRKMALELFKPFVMNRLVLNGYAHNIKSAKRLAESERPEVWDILENVVKDRPVLLNRAPTLHRLGIQAFQPVLIEGSAIRLHPLVTTAFNADFDGDKMAVHVPLSREAVWEAKKMMLSTYNMLAPSSGEPIVAPTLDMVLGCFYMTQARKDARGHGKRFAGIDDARLAYELDKIDLRAPIKVRDGVSASGNGKFADVDGDTDAWMETTPGRIIFNDALPPELGFYNTVIDKGVLKDITSQAHELLGSDATSEILDNIKDLGFGYAAKAGITIAINDVEVPGEKAGILADADENIATLDTMYNDGLLTESDRYRQTVDIWTSANDDLTKAVEDNLSKYGGRRSGEVADDDDESDGALMSNSGIGLYMMATSGAKGNIAQIKQMAGMRGLMSDPKGFIIERPVRSSFREGLSVLEYFLSTHGARKGLTDTALRTADSGYLTRRLIDVAQELIILEEDCETVEGMLIENKQGDSLLPSFADRAKSRYAAEPVADPDTGEIIVGRNEILTSDILARIAAADIPGVVVRSALACEAERGLCRMCYGLSLASWKPIMIGEAVGIIAAQSIGEPGTQLTMRTFHTGGIAGSDITSGLPRVQELFEARIPKGEAVLSEIDGSVDVTETTEGRVASVVNIEEYYDEYPLPPDALDKISLQVAEGDMVEIGDTLATLPEAPADETADASAETALAPNDIVARVSGEVRFTEDGGMLTIRWEDEERREYQIPAAANVIVNAGEHIAAGEPITAGPKNPQLILSLQGLEAVRQYLIDEVQKVYRSQGVTIHDKHIEVIVSQMLRKVEIEESGDSSMLPGDQIDRKTFDERTADVLAEGGEPATARPILLGITRASLKMDSFLSAASFQETTRVLTEAAVNGEKDYLRGLKENVIIGRLIPARLDLTEEGRNFLDMPEEEPNPLNLLARPVGPRLGFSADFETEMAQGPFGFGVPQPIEEHIEEQAPVGDD